MSTVLWRFVDIKEDIYGNSEIIYRYIFKEKPLSLNHRKKQVHIENVFFSNDFRMLFWTV